jgi:hypothetical protein
MVLRIFGFSLRTLIGTFRLKAMSHGPDRCGPDFERLLSLQLKHLIGAHGRLCRERAHDEAEVRRVFR